MDVYPLLFLQDGATTSHITQMEKNTFHLSYSTFSLNIILFFIGTLRLGSLLMKVSTLHFLI